MPESQGNEARFNMVRCPSWETCKRYGCPEITRAFCGGDDAGYGDLHPKLFWGRTKTIGKGGDCCDFLLQYRYAYCTIVSGVTLVNGSVTAHFGEMSAEGMYGGIVGAGLGSMIENCAAQAEITLPDDTANAGIVGGGLEMTSVVNCMATGTITAGNDCYGLGGVSGCGFGAEEFTNDTAENVTITTGDNCFWIGGITGYAGGYPDESFGMPVTVFTKCSTTITPMSGHCPWRA